MLTRGYGALFAPTADKHPTPAAAASGLLALSGLGQADLAVVLLVDLWSGEQEMVSTETAILVIDSALRSADDPRAQLIAAELLCRNAARLDTCQSLHWPSAVDGCWNAAFGPKTKLLIVDALTRMALASPDGFLDQLVISRSEQLEAWAAECGTTDYHPGALATAAHAGPADPGPVLTTAP